MGPQWASVILLCLWATKFRKGLANPNRPDNTQGVSAEPQNQPAAQFPLFGNGKAGPSGS